MDEERNPPFFPLRTQTRSTSGSALRTAPPPPRSRTIGRTDGRAAQAGWAGGALGVSAGCPCPRPAGPPRLFGDSLFSVSLPVPRSRGAAVPEGHRGCCGSGDSSGLWQRHQRVSETPPAPAPAPPALRPPPPRPPEQRGEEGQGEEERRGQLRRRPWPRRAPGPASAVAPAPRSLSLLPARSRGTL